MIPAKIYPCPIPANGSLPLTIEGDYFKIISATGRFVIIGDTFGELGAILPGQGLENTRFRRLTLRDTSGSANTVLVLVAGEKFVDDRVTGEVSVIDGEKARTLAGGSFVGCAAQGAVAANYSFCQLWNPVGSAKNLILQQLTMNAGAAASCALVYENAARTTNVTATNAMNKKSSANLAGAAGQLRIAAAGALPATFGYSAAVTGTSPYPFPVRGGFVIEPGWGLTMYVGTVNVQGSMNVEWFEENV